jgi:hypothetical protein
MKLLDVFATPEDARSFLNDTFTNSPLMLGKIRRMADKQAVVFGALVKGNSITSTAELADIVDHLAVARCNDFLSTKKFTKFYLPVQRTKAEYVNDLGVTVKGTIYFMFMHDVEALKNPEMARSICRQVQTLAYERKSRRDNRKFDELHHEFENTSRLITRIADRKLKLSSKKKAQLNREMEAVLAKFTDNKNGKEA